MKHITLFKRKFRPAIPGGHQNKNILGWRWELQLSKWSLEWCNTVVWAPTDAEWPGRSNCEFYAATITKHFLLGYEHVHYDGDYYMFSLGFLHFVIYR